MHIYIANDTLLVDHKYRSLRKTLGAQHAIQLGDRTMRVEIAQQGVFDTSQAVRPGFQAGDTINAQTQNLGSDPIEPFFSNLVRWDLTRSYRCPGQREEGQDHISQAAIITQADQLAVMALQAEIRSRLSNA